jgi:glycogen operon protein
MAYSKIAVWPGKPYPLGATWDGQGVNFSLFSEHAERVELCLFDPKGRREIERVPMRWQTDLIWHCYLPEAKPGWLYGYRVFGPYEPNKGLRFNSHKLLLDPYARHIVGTVKWCDALFGYRIGNQRADLAMDRRDSAPAMPKCRVIDGAFSWGDDRSPRTPWHDTVIYELHVKGFTQRNHDIPRHLRGTYGGLATDPAIDHLRRLGVTAVELMPVHAFIDDRHLMESGLHNYWGYNSIGFFAPDMRYSASGFVAEFKSMVKRLHSEGFEVILDVVYNHTIEGNHLGPTLGFRGIDNSAYYRLVPDDPRYYMDFTGCGNTLNTTHPRVLQLIMDSLRYWVLEMHVDGFRFDTAAALARQLYEVNQLSAFFDIIHQDPVISQVKLIAEPWDVSPGGYQVGNFPVGWAEWNGKYRDAMRSYWKGEGSLIGELAYRLTGSSDLYEHDGRRPFASINFVTCHDGFTLQDLVSYNDKHNQANLDDNRDGIDDNRSWNCGVEGPTEDPEILALRARQKRNLLATLFFSQGVPMILGGDEMGHTQNGNNNAYCQDKISALNWELSLDDCRFMDFVRRVIAIRKQHRVFRRRHFFQGRRIRGYKDIIWLKPDGSEMTDEEWNQSFARCLGLFLAGDGIDEYDERGRIIIDGDAIILLNSHYESIPFVIPQAGSPAGWRVLIDTSIDGHDPESYRQFSAGDKFDVKPRSLALLFRERKPGDAQQAGQEVNRRAEEDIVDSATVPSRGAINAHNQ